MFVVVLTFIERMYSVSLFMGLPIVNSMSSHWNLVQTPQLDCLYYVHDLKDSRCLLCGRKSLDSPFDVMPYCHWYPSRSHLSKAFSSLLTLLTRYSKVSCLIMRVGMHYHIEHIWTFRVHIITHGLFVLQNPRPKWMHKKAQLRSLRSWHTALCTHWISWECVL